MALNYPKKCHTTCPITMLVRPAPLKMPSKNSKMLHSQLHIFFRRTDKNFKTGPCALASSQSYFTYLLINSTSIKTHMSCPHKALICRLSYHVFQCLRYWSEVWTDPPIIYFEWCLAGALVRLCFVCCMFVSKTPSWNQSQKSMAKLLTIMTANKRFFITNNKLCACPHWNFRQLLWPQWTLGPVFRTSLAAFVFWTKIIL